ESQGGASFGFGLKQYEPGNSDTYFEYAGQGGQLGVLNGPTQRELTTNLAIANTYNLAGGAYGSLVSNGFSLEGYTATERPAVYFNYFLATDGTNAASSSMRDAARAYVSADGGVSWALVATNNSVRDPLTSELPTYSSPSATQTPLDGRQLVQELFDNTGTWRQARVDLGGFAGKANLQLRFDFTSSGHVNDLTVDSLVYGNLADPTRSASNSFEGFYVDDIVVGFANRGEMATTSAAGNQGGAFYVAPLDPTGNMQQLQGEYQLEIRRGTEFAATVSPLKAGIGVSSAALITEKQRLVSGYAIIVPTASVIQDGDAYTISNGIFTRTFEFNLAGGVTSPNVAVAVSAAMTKGQVANALANAINSQSGVAFNADPATWFNVKATTRSVSKNSDIVDLTGATEVTTASLAAPVDLTVNITPTSISEGLASQTFTVARTGPTTAALTITVSALNPAGGATTQAQVTDGVSTGTSLTVTIPANNSSVTLTLLPTDDGLLDGTQAVLIRATAAGLNSVSDVVDITDNEGGPFGALTLTLLRTTVSENGGNSGVAGYITLPDPLTPGDFDAYDKANPLVVTITSTDGSEIKSTSTQFVDGQFRASFSMDIIDELFASGNTAVTIFVTAPGYTSTSGSVTVNDTANFSYAQRLGDKNLERHQGMVIVESNIIRNVQGYGVISDAAARLAGNQPVSGAVRNLSTLNAQRLVSGVTIRNNVIANLGAGGILFSGDTNPGSQPLAPIPFGKIVNNTIYGGIVPTGYGIRVEENASPTLVNNILANTATGILIDASSASTVVGSTLFQGNTGNGTTGSDA
ncbi:MAG: right-handed parallel beta-helix repeat-containing protein, partial [Planctomycetota bacterium]